MTRAAVAPGQLDLLALLAPCGSLHPAGRAEWRSGWRCTLLAGHAGPHREELHQRWDVGAGTRDATVTVEWQRGAA